MKSEARSIGQLMMPRQYLMWLAFCCPFLRFCISSIPSCTSIPTPSDTYKSGSWSKEPRARLVYTSYASSPSVEAPGARALRCTRHLVHDCEHWQDLNRPYLYGTRIEEHGRYYPCIVLPPDACIAPRSRETLSVQSTLLFILRGHGKASNNVENAQSYRDDNDPLPQSRVSTGHYSPVPRSIHSPDTSSSIPLDSRTKHECYCSCSCPVDRICCV